jgi:N-ethylmaleimide reductase
MDSLLFQPTRLGSLIRCGGYDRSRAEADLASGRADLIAFGRPFIAHPDLPARLRAGAPLEAPDPSRFHTPGPAGYSDYPTADRAGLAPAPALA